ncbi:recombinase family protein [Pontibacter sp. JAM-7]|uniref:recombinase family protein n=1 Tax=Pontibacter sp. JAM-7 TaxID=3366581 RepID=UPI003AF5F77C
MAVVGYIRKGQIKLKQQRLAIESNMPVCKWFQEKSGADSAKVFDKLIKYLWAEDTVAVFDLGDLGQSVEEVEKRLRKFCKKRLSVYWHNQGLQLSSDSLQGVLAALDVMRSLPSHASQQRSDFPSVHKLLTFPEPKPGRRRKVDYQAVAVWRAQHCASIASTAQEFGISAATVKRACRANLVLSQTGT